jgi:glycerol-3-phosphate dehydrogenase
VLRGMDRYGGSEKRMIGGTKGSHLVVDPFPGAPKGEALYVEARKDGRPYFIVPWNGRYLIGTTDIRYEGDLDYVSADEDEIDYLLEETNYVIPEANLSRGSVLFTYSGVRPLPYQPEGAAGSVTRSHIVYDHSKGRGVGTKRSGIGEGTPRVGGLISIVGGKLTTYRNLSRQTVDMVYEKLGLKAPESRTGKVPLPGGAVGDFDTFAAEFKATSGLADELAERLLKLYGARAPDVLEMAGDDPSLRMPLGETATVETGLIGAEVLYAFRREMAQTLSDALLRRTMVGLGPRVGLDVDEAAARIAVKHLDWSEDRAKSEVEAYRRYVERYKPRSLPEKAVGV